MTAPTGVQTLESVLTRERSCFAGSPETAYLCDTTPAMEMVGMRQLPVMMWVSHLSTMMDQSGRDIHLHGLSAQTISALPALLREPAVILDASWTATRTDVVVMVLDDVDVRGNPIVAAIRPGASMPVGQQDTQISSNALLSAYNRLDIERYLSYMRRSRKVLFIDGARLDSLARKCRMDVLSPLTGLKRNRMLQPSSVLRATDDLGRGDGHVEWQPIRTCILDDLARGRSFYAPETGRYLLSLIAEGGGVYAVDVPLLKFASAVEQLARRDREHVRSDDIVSGSARCAAVGRTVCFFGRDQSDELAEEVADFARERWMPASGEALSLLRASGYLLDHISTEERVEALGSLEAVARTASTAGLKCDVASRARIRLAHDGR